MGRFSRADPVGPISSGRSGGAGGTGRSGRAGWGRRVWAGRVGAGLVGPVERDLGAPRKASRRGGLVGWAGRGWPGLSIGTAWSVGRDGLAGVSEAGRVGRSGWPGRSVGRSPGSGQVAAVLGVQRARRRRMRGTARRDCGPTGTASDDGVGRGGASSGMRARAGSAGDRAGMRAGCRGWLGGGPGRDAEAWPRGRVRQRDGAGRSAAVCGPGAVRAAGLLQIQGGASFA